MKRKLLSILMFAVCICGALAQNDAMFVYRNDGQINAFLKEDVDSIRYSHIGLDSLEHREFMVQEVWTADSVYRIPLTAIDSVSFVTPPTVFKDDVTKIEDTFIDYIIGCDGLILKLKSTTPAHLLPHSGEKLVLLDGCEALPYGFSGIVSSVQNVSDGIDVVCEQAYLEDLFESFCSVSTMYGTSDTEPMYVASSGRPERAVYNPESKEFKLGPYNYDVTAEISNGITQDGDLAFKEGASASLSITPTFRVHTFLMMGEEQGTYFSCSITGDIDVESKLSLYAGIEYSKDVEKGEFKLPIPGTYGIVNFYILPGFFGSMGASVTASVKQNRKYAFGMAYDYSSIGANVLSPSLRCRLASSSKEIEGSLDGRIAAGAFIETGFSVLSRDLIKIYVRGEFGWQLKGSLALRNSDIEEAGKDTKLYEMLKASSIETGPFANVSMGGSTLNSGPSVTLGEREETIKKWDIVPEFSDIKVKGMGASSSIEVSTMMHGDCVAPITVGFTLLDDKKNEVANFTSSEKFTNGFEKMDTCLVLTKDIVYTVYPKVRLLGFDILATPVSDEYTTIPCLDDNHTHAIDLGLPSGTKWCCHNVGASSPIGRGGYYAWGETEEKDWCSLDDYKYYDPIHDHESGYCSSDFVDIGSEISGTQYDVAHVSMGGAWCMPTYEQVEELLQYCTPQWVCIPDDEYGVEGLLVTGPNGGRIFLPYTASRTDAPSPITGYYWTGTNVMGNNTSANALDIRKKELFEQLRYYGFPVRPVCR